MSAGDRDPRECSKAFQAPRARTRRALVEARVEGQGRPARARPRGRGGRRHRHPRAQRQRQVDADPHPRHAADARLRHARRCSAGTWSTRRAVGAPPRQPRVGRGRLLQGAEPLGEHALRRAPLRQRRRGHAPARARDPRAARPAARHPRPADEAAVARPAAEGRDRAQLPHRAVAAADGRADDRARPALQERGAGAAARCCARSARSRCCSARTTWTRRRRCATAC